MLNLRSDMKPNFEDYEENLNEDRRVFMSEIKALKRVNVLDAEYSTTKRLLLEMMNFKSIGKYSSLDKDSLVKYLVECERVNERALTVYDYKSRTHKVSVSKDKTLGPIYQNGIAKEFLGGYFKHKEVANDVSELANIIQRSNKDGTLKTENGEKLLEIGYNLERKATGRYYTSNENIVGMSLRLAPALTVPSGFFLYWADFGQLDLRVAYHTILREDNPEFDEVFQTVEDKYEAFARILSAKIDVPFNLEKFMEDRKHYKVGVLARTYGASTNTLKNDIKDMDLISHLHAYFANNKKYQEYLAEIRKVIEYRVEMELVDYFGVSRTIGDIDDNPERKALNTPIQSTSNSVVVHYVNATVKRFRDAGYGPDKFRVYMLRHDEPVFMIHADCFKDIWMLEDHREVQVDDWAPLTMDYHIGYNYKIENTQLMEIYEKVVEDNAHKMQDRKVTKRKGTYHPIKKTATMHMVETARRVAVYIEGFDEQLVKVVEAPFEEQGQQASQGNKEETRNKVLGQAFAICAQRDYKYFEVYSKEMKGAGYVEGVDVYYKFTDLNNSNQYLAWQKLSSEEDDNVMSAKDYANLLTEKLPNTEEGIMELEGLLGLTDEPQTGLLDAVVTGDKTNIM